MSALQNQPLIKVSNIDKLFGAKQALNNVSFEINKGAPVALVGPNGAGKTTLFSILCGYIQQTSGEVSIMGHKPGSAATFGNLAALPQDAQLDPRFSIAQQLKFYGQLQGFDTRKSKYEAQRTLDLVGLKEVLNEKPEALSHGMRKRVTIAQALIGEPKIVMLDEATAGLDPLHAREVRELVANLSGETTFILSSHDLSELERLCEQVLYLENGVLREHQTLTNEADLSYITLRMASVIPDFEQKLKSILQVTQVKKTQDKEYLISIEPGKNDLPIDIQILQLCHDNDWQYKQMINGKTLENQLFS
ncbi:ABC transporter [Pseudoalteromonas sp. NBT06-2]|uniref:ABC transporter ATP-binding protein n=1 Tax=Pseudoalteromonas sp. NBT06-2 TaxID=2025950 RepID=UPI000BA6EB41|nr:ABC transporter ATP-binding protein [Pseudoalteromonas sp. NBT06-2]PAJ75631.1 ABC transporter [Pseudoalteromonas sp. NBT06-2]